MRLVLDLAGWTVEGRPEGGYRAAGPAGLVLEASSLMIRPDNLVAWANGVVRGLRPGGEGRAVKVLAEQNETTALGWPVHWVEVEEEVPAGPARRRLYAFYHFLDFACHAVADAPDAALMAAERSELLEVLLAGRPDWTTDEVVALAQLWA